MRGRRRSLLLFELLYKASAAALFALLAYGGFFLALRLSGFSYITRENVHAFLSFPVTAAILAVLTFLAVTGVLVDIGAIVLIMDCSARRAECRMRQVVRRALRGAVEVWKPRNLPLLGVILLLLPFMNLSMIGGLLTTLSLPDNVALSIRLNPWLYAGGALALLALSALMMRWVHAFHCFILENRTFKAAARRSAVLNRGRRLKDFFTLLLVQVAFGGGMVLMLLLLARGFAGLGRLLNGVFGVQWLRDAAIRYAVGLSLGIIFVFAVPVSYACTSHLFYQHKLRIGEAPRAAEEPAQPCDPRHGKMTRALIVTAVLLILSGLLIVDWQISRGAFNPPIEGLHTMEITAHRGASALYPENTMAAFRGAWELGADWVELDVQQTTDGQIIVMHDSDTRRTTGVRGKVWNMTYEQIAALDAGSSFSREFAGEPVPLLSQVAEYAVETGLRLNIELKPTGHEVDFEQAVIDVVKAWGLEDRCVITSQVYSVLENVKACDESMTTVYVTSLAYGSIDRLSAADHFSIKTGSTTPRLVRHIHNQGKQIYAWTVNTASAMDRMIKRNVDNIITDDITLARQRVMESHYSALLSSLVQETEEEPQPEGKP